VNVSLFRDANEPFFHRLRKIAVFYASLAVGGALLALYVELCLQFRRTIFSFLAGFALPLIFVFVFLVFVFRRQLTLKGIDLSRTRAYEGVFGTTARELRVPSENIRSARQFALFTELTPAEFELIIGAAREKRFERRETVFTQGDPVRQVTILLSGIVKVIQMGLNGNEVILRLNGAGEMVGSYRVCANCTHSSTAQAVQPCVALIWDAGVFEKLLAQIPTFRRNVVRALEERLLEMERRLRKVSTEKVGSRVNSELLRLSDRLRRPENGLLEITLSRAERAQLSDMSRLFDTLLTEGRVTKDEQTVVHQYISALNDLAVNV
jgi:CRP-like cAMP-binding protein